MGARIVLRDKRIEDAEKDYMWRSDPELARLDAAITLTMSFERYMKLFEDQLKYPTPGSHHYSIDAVDSGSQEVKFIGNCMYYDLDTVNMEAELGIVIGDRDYWSDGYGYDSVTTLLEHLFDARNLKRVYLHTLEWNIRAQRSFAKSGFNLATFDKSKLVRLRHVGIQQQRKLLPQVIHVQLVIRIER